MILLKTGSLFGFDIIVDCREECSLRLAHSDADTISRSAFNMYQSQCEVLLIPSLMVKVTINQIDTL